MKVVLSTEEFEEAYDPEKSLLPAVLENAFTVGRVCIIGSKLTDQALQNILSLCERRLEHLSPDHSDHLHYILLPSVVERKAGDQSSAEGAPGAAEETARQDVEKRYSRHRIQVVRYDKLDDSHLGLVRVIEDLADLRPPTMSGILEETDDEAYEIL